MQELVGRLTSLDPEASETLKVVTYFDALTASGVGLTGLVRAAAALAGVVAGAERRGRIIRCDPTGRLLGPEEAASPDTSSPSADAEDERPGPRVRVWLERDGAPHANDAMVVERLALAVELFEARRGPDSGLDIAVDAAAGTRERAAALARLRIGAGARIRVIATAVDETLPGAPSTVVPTRYGMLRATLDVSGALEPAGRAGLGPWTRADHAPDSWDGAIVAHRLADACDPVVDATALGVMLRLAQAYDPEDPHDDVLVLGRLDTRSGMVLRTLIEADSIRSAAARLGMHHSTVQARHEALTRELGYDPRTPSGRMRYVAAALLLRLSDAGAEG
ncbi:helix-turn-helix domain-containing protein [Streptomyces sp. NPDC051684]|uniref:helix-turn-helix domain-containing protein n=1 Tax=Streptomyces sp. NPDC051684 TaxID=3365670 RepID=UPI00379BA884